MNQKSRSSSSATKSSNPPVSLKLYALPLWWLSGLTVYILHKPTSLTYWVQPLSNQGLSSCNYLLSVLSHYIMLAPIFCITDIIINAILSISPSSISLPSTLTSFCSPFTLLAQTISVIWYRSSLSPPLNIYIFLTWNFVHHTLLIFFLPIWLLLLSLLCWNFISPTLKCYRPLTLRWSYLLQRPSTQCYVLTTLRFLFPEWIFPLNCHTLF